MLPSYMLLDLPRATADTPRPAVPKQNPASNPAGLTLLKDVSLYMSPATRPEVARCIFIHCVAAGDVAPDRHQPRRQRDLAPDLGDLIPSRALDRRRDEEIADVALAERLLIQGGHPFP
jgi:hypothetical protein